VTSRAVIPGNGIAPEVTSATHLIVMPTVRNGSIVVSYDIRGAGPAAMLFNHTSTSNLSWSERFLESLAEELTLVTPDYRGTGLSSPALNEFSLADLAADGIAILDAEEIDKVLVIGTSMGGAVAQEFALNFPDRVYSLVLIGTFAGNKHFVPADSSVITLFEQALQLESKLERWRQALPATYSRAFLENNEDLALELELKGLRYTTEDTLRRHAQAVSKFEAYDRLPSVSVRCLVMHGTVDPIIPLENGLILAGRLPNSEFVALENVGHLPAVEKPLETADRIRRFAQKSV
jgi:3-oxoadipate enol-lactonase